MIKEEKKELYKEHSLLNIIIPYCFLYFHIVIQSFHISELHNLDKEKFLIVNSIKLLFCSIQINIK